MFLSKIILYDESNISQLRVKEQKEFLEKTFGIKTETRTNISNYTDDDAKRIASCRVFDTKKPFVKCIPTPEEIEQEMRCIVEPESMENIVMYDGIELQNFFTSVILPEERSLEFFHIIFTNRLTCTFDYNDYRYHGRAVIASNPSIISTKGIIEAPAKPREYYYDLMYNIGAGLNVDALKDKYKGQYVELNDPSFPVVVQGYLLQAVFYYLTGEPFCRSRDCRLFNSHWQSDLIHSQLKTGRLCERHKEMLYKIKKNHLDQNC